MRIFHREKHEIHEKEQAIRKLRFVKCLWQVSNSATPKQASDLTVQSVSCFLFLSIFVNFVLFVVSIFYSSACFFRAFDGVVSSKECKKPSSQFPAMTASYEQAGEQRIGNAN